MPRHYSGPDHRHRTRRVTTEREIRQAEEIAALKAELRAIRAVMAKDHAKPMPSRLSTPKPATQASYGAFLDHVGEKFTQMINKGREYFDSCPTCGNVKLPCIDPLIELERLEFNNGEMDALIFSPALAGGSGLG
jgi:hypothetical protein